MGGGNSIRGLFAGGIKHHYKFNLILLTISSKGNATDFGDLVSNNYRRYNIWHHLRQICDCFCWRKRSLRWSNKCN